MKLSKKISIVGLIITVSVLSACATLQSSGVDPESELNGATAGKLDVEGFAGLVDSLEAVGAEVEEGGEIQQVFFSPVGKIVKVNGEDVQVFEYPSAEDAEREAETVSSDGSSIGTSMVTWVSAPHFFRSGSVIALYVGENPEVIELLTGALGEQFAGR